jgi:hypothetical protein
MAALACIFQLVRVLSSILFALMALVLPMAGVQRYVCTVDMKFSGKVTECPNQCGDCCKGEGVPECMVEADLIPDAELPNLGQMHILPPDGFIFVRISAENLRQTDACSTRLEDHRDPPDPLDWYVKQQRLLI